jgi:hypothetical protein
LPEVDGLDGVLVVPLIATPADPYAKSEVFGVGVTTE